MEGLRIIQFGFKNENSEFEFFFKALLPLLKDFYWIFDIETFFAPIDWYSDNEGQTDDIRLLQMERDIIKTDKEHYMKLSDNNYIQKYCKYIRDDWNSLYCFDANKITFEELVEVLNKQDHSFIDLIRDGRIKVFFNNFDGLFWEIYSISTEYLNIVENIKEKYSDRILIKSLNLNDIINSNWC